VKREVILDTGPLVALIDAHDRHHIWAVQQWADIEPPLLTCESVISEACFLLDQIHTGGAPVFEMLARNAVTIAFRLADHVAGVRALLRKYADVPMSVADASLVRMAEEKPQSPIITLDRDFQLYRKHGRQVIPLVAPSKSR
jgi:uncharacterized protein